MKLNRFQRFVHSITPPIIMRGLFGITFGTPGADTWQFARDWVRGRDAAGPLEEPYAKASTLATAISRVAEDAASIPWELFPDGEDTDAIDSHPVLDLLEKPNPRLNGSELWVYTYLIKQLFGEAFWYYPDLTLGTGNGGLRATRRPSGGIMLLDPRQVRVRVSEESVRWFLRTQTGEVDLDGDKLTQFKRPNPYDLTSLRGLPEIEALRMEIETDYYGSRWNRDFFAEQNGIPTIALLPHAEDASTREQRQDFITRFTLDHRSGKRSVAALPPGWTFSEMGLSQKDMEFRALREYSREQILALVGVPPFYAGVLDKANYANAREQKELYWLGKITRFVTDVQTVLNADFLPKIGVEGIGLYANWEAVRALTENLSEKTDIAGKLFDMGFTKRMINERLDLGFDVDQLEDADVGYLTFNRLPVSTLSDPSLASVYTRPAEEESSGQGEDDDEPEEGNGESRSIATGSEARRSLVWRNIIARTRDLENRMNAAVRRNFAEIEAEVMEHIDGVRGWLASQRKQVDDDDLFDKDKANRKLIKSTRPVHEAGVVRGGESVLADLDLAIAFDIRDPAVIAQLSELSHKITRINDTIEAMLRASLAEGVAAGESPQQLAKRVRDVMAASKGRSFVIARTEVGFAFNTGRNEGMKQAGIERHEWLSARDSKVRDPHKAEDGQRVPIGEPFPNTNLLYPQDPSGPPGQIINCRCVALPVVE